MTPQKIEFKSGPLPDVLFGARQQKNYQAGHPRVNEYYTWINKLLPTRQVRILCSFKETVQKGIPPPNKHKRVDPDSAPNNALVDRPYGQDRGCSCHVFPVPSLVFEFELKSASCGGRACIKKGSTATRESPGWAAMA
eukprot:1769513-Amphidinium_carterae.1